MWKLLGIVLLLAGVAGILCTCFSEGKEKQRRVENVILFLQKSRYTMQNEKVKVINYFRRYIEQDILLQSDSSVLLERALAEIIEKLSSNVYPHGQMVWEEVFRKEEQNWNLDCETFEIIVQAGNGFFGRSRMENINLLEKSIRELEAQQAKMKQKYVQERKVWVPVGMLGTMMIIILFL